VDIVTIDFETYYDRDYSLSKITTEAYIRSHLFEVIGVGVKVNDGPVDTYSGSDVGKFLKSLDYSNKAILCHNTMFDGAILSWHFGIRPKLWLDTLSMARPLHQATVGGSLKALAQHYGLGQKGEEVVHAMGKRRRDFSPTELAAYMRYCANDIDLTYALFKKLRKGFPVSELRVIDTTIRMYTEPMVELDGDRLVGHLTVVRAEKQALMDTLGGKGKEFIMSNDKFAKLLRKRGVEPPTKISATTGKETYAFAKTDLEFTALQEHPDPVVQTLVAARLGLKSTLEETRTTRLIEVSGRGRLPIMLNYYGAHTGRFSGGDKLNLQNLPRGGALRHALRAPAGHKIISCDSSQIEARMVAYIAGQADLVQQFREGRDVYSEFATKFYGRPVTKADKLERHVGKAAILGLGYGMSAEKFQLTLKRGKPPVNLPDDDVDRLVHTYRTGYHHIVKLWGECGYALSSMVAGRKGRIGAFLTYSPEGIDLPNGMKIRYHGLSCTDRQFTYIQDRRMFERAVKARLDGDDTGVGAGLIPGQSRIYGAMVTENCLAGDTQVLTERGWVPIVDVQRTDRLWDGLGWTKHGGLIYQGDKATTVVNGVRMTPDHNVLTERGWRCASSSEGLHRAGFWLPDGSEVSGDKWPTLHMDLPVQLRDGSFSGGYQHGKTCPAWWAPIVRMQAWGRKQVARYDKTPGLLGVAFDARSVPLTYAPSVAQLRGTGYQGTPGVGAVVRGVLGGHGADISGRSDTGSEGQQRGLHARELSVGDSDRAGREQTRGATGRYNQGAQTDGRLQIDAAVSVASEPVYDILNAGPYSRFVVRGSAGPFIVHNCVQALARIVVAEQMLKIRDAGYHVAFQVHDENVCVVPEDQAEQAEKDIVGIMSTPPSWAPDLPVACEAGTADTYGET
jgi:DNA polymerase I-like protein with 3'-5' exonuclease and polymerase domains